MTGGSMGSGSRRDALRRERIASRRARARRSTRSALLAVLAMVAVAGMTATHALPSFAVSFSEDASASPALDRAVAGDVQRFTVSGDLAPQPLRRDLVESPTGSVSVWRLPTPGVLRDGFGPRLAQPVAGVSSFHRGQDIGRPCGSPVRAAADGVVQQSGYYGTYGNWILLDHGGDLQTGYAHTATLLVRAGQRVVAGQVIATVGSTGASSGCHLHLETHQNGVAVDPVAFLAARGVRLG